MKKTLPLLVIVASMFVVLSSALAVEPEPPTCLKKVFATLRGANAAFGFNKSNIITLHPVLKYMGTIDFKKFQAPDGQYADAWTFQMGTEEAVSASSGSARGPGIVATGTVAFLLDRKTNGDEVCRLIEYDIQPQL